MQKRPDTKIVTCTRRRAAFVNDLAVEALYCGKELLTSLPGDVEFNPANYDERGKFRTDRRPLPAAVPIYKGMRLYLTQNLVKSVDYVNGMGCEVLHWDSNQRQLRVKTDTGYIHMLTPWTDVDHGRVSFYPVRLGYCSTIHKVQGDQFTHITVWLDTPKCEGAAYTALSRVSRADQVLLGGVLTEDHFVPAG
eukprot:7243066-Pyramimonas_sp.AAC.1